LPTTSDVPKPYPVLETASTTSPPSVLSQGMTAKEQAIFSKLLVDLFLAPPRKRPYQQNKSIFTVTRTNDTVSKFTGDTQHEPTAKKTEKAVQP
jgi:hypothetical protein